MEFRTRYNYGSNKPYYYKSEQPSLTDQRYAKDTDLSRIVGIDGGQLYIKDQQAFINAVNAKDYSNDFQDVSDIGDFASIHRTMTQAQYKFDELPSNVRAKYNNNLVEFLTAMNAPVVSPGPVVENASEFQKAEDVTPPSSAEAQN